MKLEIGGKSKKQIQNRKQKYIFDSRQYETVIWWKYYTGKASIIEAEEDRSNLLENLVEFNI